MTWRGKKVIDINTMEIGTVIADENLNRTRGLCVLFPDNSEQLISMENICVNREYEIWSQEQYKHLFYKNDNLESLPYEWLPFADEGFVKNPIELIENWAKLSPKLKDNHIYKDRKKHEIIQ